MMLALSLVFVRNLLTFVVFCVHREPENVPPLGLFDYNSRHIGVASNRQEEAIASS